MQMTKEMIDARAYECLDNYYIQADNIYTNRIFGVFLYGSMNYGFATKESDFDAYAIVLPAFDTTILKNQKLETHSIVTNTTKLSKITFIDFREFVKKLQKGNISFLELLFTKYYKLNFLYQDLYKEYFLNNREKVARANEKNVLFFAKSIGLSYLTQHKGRATAKDLYNGYRMLHFFHNYKNGSPFEDCIQPKNEKVINFLAGIRKFEKGDKGGSPTILKQIVKVVDEFKNLETITKSNMTFNEVEEIWYGAKEILKRSLFSEFELIVDKDKLRNAKNELTPREASALRALYRKIGKKGMVSLSRAASDMDTTKAVLANLLNKLKQWGIITTRNRGAYGTEIEFLIKDVKKFMEDL